MPTPIATLNWTGRSESEVVNGVRIDKTISRTYLIRDAETEEVAKTATGLPTVNTPFATGSPYRAKARVITAQKGPTTWECRIDYGIPDLGTYPTNEADPLLRPTVLTWGKASAQRPMERDRGSTPTLIRNSAGDFFDPLPVEDREIDTLTATKWFPFYDRSLARQFAGCVNAANYVLQDSTFLPGEILCKSIVPVTSYELVAPSDTPNPAAYVQVAATFWLDNDSRATPGVSGDPFDAHLVDQGLYGWYAGTGGTKRGRFCTVKDPTQTNLVVESVLDAPVLLNGEGLPLDPLVKVAASPEPNTKAYAPVQTPESLNARMSQWDDRWSPFDQPTSTRMWRFYKAYTADFSGLPF